MTESENGVVLCACHGRVTDRLLEDEIGQFMKKMAPDARVLVGDDLCQSHALRLLIEKEWVQPRVIGACSRLRRKLHLWEDVNHMLFGPYAVRIVDLLAEAGEPDSQYMERVKLLLWAQWQRAGEYQGVRADNLKPHFSLPGGRVNRRELFSGVLPWYEVVPYVMPNKCQEGGSCRLCQDSCPHRAISIEGDKASIIQSSCRGCGACVAACPQRAILYPTFSLEELDSEMEALLTAKAEQLEPRIIALTCRDCLPGNSGDEKCLKYPPHILPIAIPCLDMASPWLMLRAFDMGTQGLALIGGKKPCHPEINSTLEINLDFVKTLLKHWNISPERLELFELAEDNQTATGEKLCQFARDIADLGTTPLSATRHHPLPTEGLLLPALIKEMGNKLPHTQRTIFSGNIPFGRLTIVGRRCTGCGLCTLDCPTAALAFITSDETGTYRLLFSHADCTGCGRCVQNCPENCLRLESALDFARLEQPPTVLFEDSMGRCSQCGAPVAPAAMLVKVGDIIRENGGNLTQPGLCVDCRRQESARMEHAFNHKRGVM